MKVIERNSVASSLNAGWDCTDYGFDYGLVDSRGCGSGGLLGGPLKPFGSGGFNPPPLSKYCLMGEILLLIYNYRLKLSKKWLKLLLQKSRKSLVFHYRGTFLLFLKRKVESRICFLISLLAGGFYYHSLRSRQKVESRKVSGGL